MADFYVCYLYDLPSVLGDQKFHHTDHKKDLFFFHAIFLGEFLKL